MDSNQVLFLLVRILSTFYTNDEGFFKGKLSEKCINNYFNLFYTKLEPPQSYLYWHEVMPKPSAAPDQFGIGYRIVGGRRISIKDAPYQVMYGEYCGGSLLTPSWVLTAAHCGQKVTHISAGNTLASQGTRFDICTHFVHPGWSAKEKAHSMDYDYQLLLLETPVPVTSRSRPIAIGREDEVKPDAIVVVSGWGHTSAKNSSMQEALRHVYLPIISSARCRVSKHKAYQTITSRMFCASYSQGSMDACQGDSGGPVVSDRGLLLGLVSFGIGCAEPDQPGVYASVVQARPWIRYITHLPL